MVADKVAVVTGGTRGIGRAIAKSLVGAGATVAITARDEKDLVEAVPSMIKDSIPKADAEEIKKKLDEAGAAAEIK